jgi:uncharacterized protein (DUF488 family)
VMTEVYTVGHSNHSMERFLEFLTAHGVEAVVDVRRRPYSSFSKHYNKRELEMCLRERGFSYFFLGEELGGRREETGTANEGVMDYDKVRRLPGFRAGIDRLLEIAASKKTVMVCAEANPYRCHRHHVIAQELLARGVDVVHILPEGKTVSAELGSQTAQQRLFP